MGKANHLLILRVYLEYYSESCAHACREEGREGALLDAPHELPQIAALDPLLFSATAYPEPSSSSASAANAPTLAYFADNPRRLPADY